VTYWHHKFKSMGVQVCKRSEQKKNRVERKYLTSNEQFWDIFPWQDFFPNISPTCFKFPDISRFSRQMVTLNLMNTDLKPLTRKVHWCCRLENTKDLI